MKKQLAVLMFALVIAIGLTGAVAATGPSNSDGKIKWNEKDPKWNDKDPKWNKNKCHDKDKKCHDKDKKRHKKHKKIHKHGKIIVVVVPTVTETTTAVTNATSNATETPAAEEPAAAGGEGTTVPMKKTGVPIIPALLSALAMGGGLLYQRFRN